MKLGDAPSRGGRRAARLAYLALSVADVALAASSAPGAARARRVTKPLLMPALMVGADGATRRALALSGAGDVALLGSTDAAFTAGLGAFLGGQLAWIRALRARRSLVSYRGCSAANSSRSTPENGPSAGRSAASRKGLLRRRPVVAVPYVAAALGLNAYLWHRAGKDRIPVAVYSAALTAMALAAADTGDPVTAGGGALFMASDSLIALKKFAGVELPAHDAWVMGTYTAAQAMLARD